jgi:hypothetical protein
MSPSRSASFKYASFAAGRMSSLLTAFSSLVISFRNVFMLSSAVWEIMAACKHKAQSGPGHTASGHSNVPFNRICSHEQCVDGFLVQAVALIRMPFPKPAALNTSHGSGTYSRLERRVELIAWRRLWYAHGNVPLVCVLVLIKETPLDVLVDDGLESTILQVLASKDRAIPHSSTFCFLNCSRKVRHGVTRLDDVAVQS